MNKTRNESKETKKKNHERYKNQKLIAKVYLLHLAVFDAKNFHSQFHDCYLAELNAMYVYLAHIDPYDFILKAEQ